MRNKKDVKKPLLAVGAALLIVAVCLIVYIVGARNIIVPEDTPLSVYFFDVGQGDCELIRCEDVNVLIDGGEADYAKRVEGYLKKAGVDKIDCYILTHPHSDHIGAASYLIDHFLIGRIMTTSFSELNVPTTMVYENFLASASASDAVVMNVKGGEDFRIGALSLSVLSPLQETDDYNDMSIAIRASYKNVSFLLMGDASVAVEEQILAQNFTVRSDVLKVGHHGSGSSTSPAFLKAASPKYAVISCGLNNPYGHPDSNTVNLLQEAVTELYRTDVNGTVQFYSDGKNLQVRCSK